LGIGAGVRDQAAFGGVGWRRQGDLPRRAVSRATARSGPARESNRARATASDLLDAVGHLPAAIAAALL